MFNQILDPFLRFIGWKDPHNFEHSLKFIGHAQPRPIPKRNAFHYHQYQNVVFYALRRNLQGSVAEHIINDYHHPEATIDLIVNTLKKSDRPRHIVPQDSHFISAWEHTRSAFAPLRPTRPVHTADLRWYNFNWHPNVEEPFASDKKLIALVQEAATAGLLPDGRMSFGNLKNVVFIRLREFLHRIKRKQITAKETLYPMVNIHVKPALTTTDKTKVRVIAGVSKLHVLPSAQFFWPLFRDWIERHESPMLWGFETILGGIQKLHLMYQLERPLPQTFISIDWPAYDLTVLFEERFKCYECYETYFDFENGYIPTKHYRNSKADPTHLRNLWTWIKEASRKMPIRLPDGTLYEMADWYWFVYSGLFQTQSDDSLINHARILCILSSLGFDIKTIVKILVQGDDSLTRLLFNIPPDQHLAFKLAFKERALFYFNCEAHEDKSDISNSIQNVEVLGYKNQNGYPVRDKIKLLAMLAHPRGAPTLETLKARVCGFQWASAYKYPDVTAILLDIWNYLDRQGITATPLKQQRDVILHGETLFKITTDHFPTEQEVTRHLRQPYIRTLIDKEEYFPGYTEDSHFVDFY